MRVTVRLFAILRQSHGADTLALEMGDAATVGDALALLESDTTLGELLQQLPVVMAVNREYASPQTRLRADDELALIPPVSGGQDPEPEHAAPAGAVRVRISDEPLSIDSATRAVRAAAAGAIVVFCGVTREVAYLHYEAYREMALPQLERIAQECLSRHKLQAIAIEHRLGEVPLGEPSVVAAVSAAHRGDAFAGAREAIDRLKAEAPIWKREEPIDGSGEWAPGTVPPLPVQEAPRGDLTDSPLTRDRAHG